jgi:C-terminal processing protease CtpA/Prc
LDDPSLQNGGGVAGSSNSDIQTAAGDTTIGSPCYMSEEQFDVIAPEGLLGLILETSIDDGRPMVFSIKPSSPLAHILKVGDRLIALDGIDVSKLRASDASRMIAEKKDRTRQLVFSRLVKANVIPNKRY